MTKINSSSEYRFPKEFAAMTLNFEDLTREVELQEYMSKYGFALAADFIVAGVKPDQVEKAVGAGLVSVTTWPKAKPATHFFWAENSASRAKLTNIASVAVKYCFGGGESEPIGGTFVTVGAEIGSQQLALAGLIHAREQGIVRELELSGLLAGNGPLYVVRDSYAGRLFDVILPEQEPVN